MELKNCEVDIVEALLIKQMCIEEIRTIDDSLKYLHAENPIARKNCETLIGVLEHRKEEVTALKEKMEGWYDL